MRVISGKAKGTKLETLEGDNTRPTLDRVKEALFNILQTRLYDANILDLFAGSGALGIEALSRGARKVTFCDKEIKAIKIIKNNLTKTKFEEKSTVINQDYIKCLNNLKEKFDIIFLDPPYKKGFVKDAVIEIIDKNLLNEEGIIIIETDDENKTLEQLKELDINVYDLRKYGRVKLLFLNRKG